MHTSAALYYGSPFINMTVWTEIENHVPTALAINSWIRNFEETGSAMEKKPPGSVQLVVCQNIETV